MNERDKLILEHLYLVRIIASQLIKKIPPNIEKDDLIQEGMFGLIDAANKFRSTEQVKFKSYAGLKIKGSMIDYLRNQNFLSRSVQDNINKIEYAKELLQQSGTQVSINELSKLTNLSKKDIQRIQKVAASCKGNISIDEFPELRPNEKQSIYDLVNRKPDAVSQLISHELNIFIQSEINKLSWREQRAVRMYFYNDLTCKEIGKLTFVTESRVNQLVTKALKTMKVLIGKNSDPFL